MTWALREEINSQAKNRGQIEGEHFRKEGQYEQRQRGWKFMMALWDKRYCSLEEFKETIVGYKGSKKGVIEASLIYGQEKNWHCLYKCLHSWNCGKKNEFYISTKTCNLQSLQKHKVYILKIVVTNRKS